ncbi:MAG: hypothetical protein FJ272_22530, partial [Planctomycetes bacterium]|nr:hypothetical protein [Planctomycetota bacterium]
MLRRTTALLGLAACLGLTAHAQPLAVQTSDGLRLELSAKGQVAACQVGEQKLPLTGPGGFSVIDYQNQPTPPNLVPNAGFEEGAQGWSLAKGQEIDKTVAHSGAASVRITVPGPEPGSSSVGRTIEVKPGRRYRVGLWMRRQKAGVCGAYVSELDSAGKLAGKVTQMGLAVPTKDDEWRFCYRDIETGPQTAKLLLRGDIYRSTGTVWLDDFTLHERGDLVAKPVEGVAQPDGKSVKFQGKVSNAALELQATFAAGAAIRVDGELKDTSGKDRAI